MTQKTVALNFDGAISSPSGGRNGAGVIPGPVVPGIAEAIRRLRADGYSVVVVSSRCSSSDGVEAVRNYLIQNRIDVDCIMEDIPSAACFIDDRVIRFDGDASVIVDRVKSFHSWTEGSRYNACSTEKLRPCRAATYHNGQKIPVRGWFHMWASDFEEFDAGPGNQTVAIVEQDDGNVVTCPPDTVRFLDR